MGERKLHCEIITPEKVVYEGDVDMVVVPGAAGELGIMPLHMPIITTLKPGEVRLKIGQEEQEYIAIDGGYMEVREDKVNILADAAEFASKIDVAELNRNKQDIEEKMDSLEKDGEEFFDAARKLEQIANRLNVAGRRK